MDIRAIYTSTEEVKGRGLLFQEQSVVVTEEMLIENIGLVATLPAAAAASAAAQAAGLGQFADH